MGARDVHEVASATLFGDATAHLVLDGAMHSIQGSSDADARQQVLHLVAAKAREQNAAVLLVTRDRFGSGHLRVRPGGVVEAVGAFVPAGPDDVLTPLAVDTEEVPQPAAAGPDTAPGLGQDSVAEPDSVADSVRAAREAAALEALYRAAASEPDDRELVHGTPRESGRTTEPAEVAEPVAIVEPVRKPAGELEVPSGPAPVPEQVVGESTATRPDAVEAAPPKRATRVPKSRSRRVSVPSVPDSVGPADSLWGFTPTTGSGAGSGSGVDPAPVTEPPAAASPTEPVEAVLPTPAPLPTPVGPVPLPQRHEPTEQDHADAVRTSFLAPERERPSATRGWRGALARTGLPVGPNRFERGERTDVEMVRRTWTGPRTIAVVNGKGGANKTPTTALLAAVFARLGGAGVLAWDNNDARGTLGWRTDSAGHELSAGEVLAQAQWLLSPDAGAADLAGHVHHQAVDRYDVLRASPLQLSGEHRIDEREFDALHAVASKYYRLVIIDSGNDESSPRWRRMIDRTDQLVVATTALGEHAEAGALLLEALSNRDERSRQLAERAVVVVSQSDRSAGQVAAKRLAEAFAPMVRATITVPYDRALHSGRIRYDTLEPDTRRAWLTAAAATAEGL